MERWRTLREQVGRYRGGGPGRNRSRGTLQIFSPTEYLERRDLWAQGLRAFSTERLPLRRAKAFRYVCERMTPQVGAEAVFAGSQLFNGWPGEAVFLPEEAEQRQRIAELETQVGPLGPDPESAPGYVAAEQAQLVTGAGGCTGHCVPGYGRLLEWGLEGLRDRVAEARSRRPESDPFYESVAIALDGASLFIERHAEAAARTGPADLASLCRKLAHEPAENFREALQLLWFGQVLAHLEQGSTAAVSFGRFDQYLLPFYQADLQSGRLSREEAADLLACFFVKCLEGEESQNLVVGGVDCDGSDASNDLTRLVLEVAARLAQTQPSISIRVHAYSPDWLYTAITHYVQRGTGQPAMFGDETVIAGKMARGFPLEEARDFGIIGCYEAAVPGKENAWTVGGNVYLPKALELALNQGCDPLTGKKAGIDTGPCHTFGELVQAVEDHVEHAVNLVVANRRRAEEEQARTFTLPFLSSLYEGPLEKGLDYSAGGCLYNTACVCAIGLANTADALSAIWEMVFERQEYALGEVVEWIRHDFSGSEALRTRLRSRPRYGSGDSRAVELARQLGQHFVARVNPHECARGGPYQASLGMYRVHEQVDGLGAGPDGRRRGEPLAMGVGPSAGGRELVPTEALRAAAELPQRLAPNGNPMQLRLPPGFFTGKGGRNAFRSLIQVYFDRGGQHLQVNVLAADTLRQAQAQPDQYRDLIMRVSGLSAYFVDLEEVLQDDLIARAEKGL